jgi:broad specificity phosphatase PhoE
MEIVLVRHGRPALPPQRPISGRRIGQWVRAYDEVGIAHGAPPEQVRRLVAAAGCVVTSDLRRSVESAARLTSSHDVRVDPDLREAPLPDSLGLAMPMPPGVWIVLARIVWWLRWCASEENVDATRQRADRVASRLCALAAEHGSVAVVGHGMFNRYVARQLVTRGWRGPTFMPATYWSAARFRRSATPAL